jgi:hypothetical protein
MQQPIEFRWNGRRLGWLAALIAVIGAGGLALLAEEGSDVKALGLGWAAAFGYGAYALLKRRGITEPVVIVSADGVRDTRIADAALPWSAIARVEGFEVENISFVGLHCDDEALIRAGIKPSVRAIAKAQRLVGLPPVTINMAPLDGSNEDLLAAISAFRAEVE